MNAKKLMMVVAVLTAVMFAATSVNAMLVYEDSFTRSDLLGGTSPDVVNIPGATWTANAAWNTYGDGITAKTTTGGFRASAYLPLTLEPNFIYTLSMDLVVDETYDANSWLALGFSSSNGTTAWPVSNDPWFYDRNVNQGTPSVPLVASNSLRGVTDAGANFNVAADGVAVPHSLTVILNTRPAAWTAEFKLDGSTVVTDTLDANPTINYVGFSVGAFHKVAVDNFSLDAVPEPATSAMLMIGAVLTVLARQRRK